ncbi:MAG: glycosyltransferase family 4 protein [Vicingaceae bacterium]|nr:glycosyltransferase family 4 protein [Vicingaceae bacterium]
MKIAIVCGHFLPTMGYIEVHLANALHQIEHEVEVFTSRVIPTYVQNVAQLTDNTPYKINRLATSFSLGQMIKSKELVTAVEKFEPQLVICIGVGKLFPKPIYKMKNRKFKLVTLFGDNEETYTSSGTVKKMKDAVLQKVFKKKIYIKAIKKSDVLLPYTPSTNAIIKQFIDQKCAAILTNKSKQISLGFDDTQFYYDEVERIEQRKQLGISPEANVLITATRVVPEKKLERIIDFVDAINQKGIALSYVIVGFQDDDYGKELKAYIARKACKNQIYCKPFSGVAQIRRYYNSADSAVFSRAAISIFEALATGLYLILPQQNNISHILNEHNGKYFNELNEKTILAAISSNKEQRQNRVEMAQQFSYRNLVNQIIAFSEV